MRSMVGVRRAARLVGLLAAVTTAAGACGVASEREPTEPGVPDPPTVPPPADPAPLLVGATVGTPVRVDLAQRAERLRAILGVGLTYRVTFLGTSQGLTHEDGIVAGTPERPAVVRALVEGRSATGATATDTLTLVAFAPGLALPTLPASRHAYSDASSPLPFHLTVVPGFPAGFRRPELDSTAANPTTDAGATLGRVLFHDTRLSVNDSVSCATCHMQSRGFSDTGRVSIGVFGRRGTRRSMALGGLRFTTGSGFFWDLRASSLEELALMPVQNPDEMGATIEDVVAKVTASSYYAPLFREAFGSPTVTAPRIARALAQYMRALTPARSRFDGVFDGFLVPDVTRLPDEVRQGHALFIAKGCAGCHFSSAQMMAEAANNGLDAVPVDTGAGRGRFRPPSLRNVAVHPPYMHDGRFRTLEEVIAFYDGGVQPSNLLDPRMRTNVTGLPRRLDLTAADRRALVAFLESLTDSTFLREPKFSDPFRRP